jgi:Fe-S-cluster containining protein
MANPIFIPISSLHERASQWFERSRAAMLGELPCRQGCSLCCRGPFAITVLDAEVLRDGMAALALAVREDIEACAQAQANAMEAEFPRLAASKYLDDWPDSEIDALASRFADLPCPALDSAGDCRVYAYRPLTCRMMGIPTDGNGLVQGACEIQTAVPVVGLPIIFREQEERLAEGEASDIGALRESRAIAGDEVWLPSGFLAGSFTPSRPEPAETASLPEFTPAPPDAI